MSKKNTKFYSSLAVIGALAMTAGVLAPAANAAPGTALKAGIVKAAPSVDFNNGGNSITIKPKTSNTSTTPTGSEDTNAPGQAIDDPVTNGITYTLYKVDKIDKGGQNILQGADWATKTGAASIYPTVAEAIKDGKLQSGYTFNVGAGYTTETGKTGVDFTGLDNGLYYVKDNSTNPTHSNQSFFVILPLPTKAGATVNYEKNVVVYPKSLEQNTNAKEITKTEYKDGKLQVTYDVKVPVIPTRAGYEKDNMFLFADPLANGVSDAKITLNEDKTDAKIDNAKITADKFTFDTGGATKITTDLAPGFTTNSLTPTDVNVTARLKDPTTTNKGLFDSTNAGRFVVFTVTGTYDKATTNAYNNIAYFVPNGNYSAEKTGGHVPSSNQTTFNVKDRDFVLVKAGTTDEGLPGATYEVFPGKCEDVSGKTAINATWKAAGENGGAAQAGAVFTTGTDGKFSLNGLIENNWTNNNPTVADYCVKQKTPAPGYKLNTTPVDFKVDNNDTPLKLTADPIDGSDNIGFNILGFPLSGSQAALLGLAGLGGIAGLAGAIYLAAAKRRKGEEQE